MKKERKKERKKQKARKKKSQASCAKCGKPFVWMLTTKGKWIPVEPDSYDGANVYVPGTHEPHFSHCGKKEKKVDDHSSEARHFDDCKPGDYTNVNGRLFLCLPSWPVTILRAKDQICSLEPGHGNY